MRPLHLFIFLVMCLLNHYYSFVAVDLETLHREIFMVKSVHTENVTLSLM